MFKDEHRQAVWDQVRQHDLKAFRSILQPELFRAVSKHAGVPLGHSPLCLVNLVWLAASAALFPKRNFSGILVLAQKRLGDLTGWTASARKNRTGAGKNRSRHDPYGTDPALVSEEAFLKARRKMPFRVWSSLLLILAERLADRFPELVRWKRFRLLALDGTCVKLGSWSRLRKHFGCAANQAGRLKAQARLVMLQLPLVRLPWRYELCPLSDGERTVAERLLHHIREDDLVLMDQGFWSYGLFHQIQASGAYFAIRLYPQVRMQTLQRLGHKDRLVTWKTPTGPRWRDSGLPDAITLRVVDYQIKGFRPTAVVTNVLDPNEISRDEWVRLVTDEKTQGRLTQGLYHRRWEIETTFHELKVVQEMEGNLRSRTPEGIQYEVAGHILLYTLIRWLIIEAAENAECDPLDISFRQTLTELLDISPALLAADYQRTAEVLLPRLLKRIAEHRVPYRPGRHYPRPHDTQIKDCGKGKQKIPAKIPSMWT